jgi:membrane associated rhomboid family serine protease
VSTRRRRPWLTASVFALTAVVSVVGLADHHVLHALERHHGELGDGEPWRLLSSLLVHRSWLALLFNLLLLALVGIAVEQRHSRVEWGLLYLTGGLVGELVGLAWQPHGAGNSVAVFGVAGALVVDALRDREPALLALGYAIVVLVTLGADDIGGAAGAAILVMAWSAAGAAVAATRQGRRIPPAAPRALGVLALALAVALAALADIHGPALFAGVVVALLWDALAVRDRAAARIAPPPPPRSAPGA